ncbi:MAG: DinB family protein [Rhodothermales bacterium]
MPSYTNLLEEALEAWEDARLGALDEAANIPEEQWDFRPTPEVRSVRELVVHILEVAMLMTGELTRPDTNLQRAPWPKMLKTYAQPAYDAETRGELLKLMRSQLTDGVAAFRNAGELHMLQFIRRFDGKMGTRLAWFQHGIAQEMYHRGQLATYARLVGIEPALTRKIRGG